MNKKYHSKHAILANKIISVPSAQAIKQIRNWFSKRDYRLIADLEDSRYFRELEMRLHILQTLTFHQLYIGPSDGQEIQLWKRSCLTNTAALTTLFPKEDAPQGSCVSVEKSDYLSVRQGIAEQYQEPLPELMEAATLDDIKTHTKQTQIALNRHEYLCPLEPDGKQILISIDLSSPNKAILDEVLIQLEQVRKKLDIPEIDSQKRARNNKSLAPFINRYAIQYLDLLIYRIQPEMTTAEVKAYRAGATDFLRPQPNHIWELTDIQTANFINHVDLGAETIREWRTDTYEMKLLNSDYMQALLRNIRRELILPK